MKPLSSDRTPLLACLSPHAPSPSARHAGASFLYHHLEEARARFEVVLVLPASPANLSSLAEWKPDYECRLVPEVPSRLQLGDPLLYFSRGPAPAPAFRRGISRSRAALRDVILRADLVELQWAELLPVVELVRKVRPAVSTVAFPHDVATQAARRRAQYASTSIERVASSVLAVSTRRREPALVNKCDAGVVFSDADLAEYRRIGVRVDLLVLDPPLAVAADETPRRRTGAVFLGAMHRPENAGAVRWLLRSVWPAVLAAVPQATLTVVGADPPADLGHTAFPGVVCTGFVDEVTPYLRESSVFVAPLLRGAGLKFKVVEAMSHGLAVAATPVAAEGIVERVGAEAFACITQEPSELASAIIRCLSDERRAAAIGALARERALRAFSWRRSHDAVIDVLEDLSRRSHARSAGTRQE